MSGVQGGSPPCRGLGQRPKTLCRSTSRERCERPKGSEKRGLRLEAAGARGAAAGWAVERCERPKGSEKRGLRLEAARARERCGGKRGSFQYKSCFLIKAARPLRGDRADCVLCRKARCLSEPRFLCPVGTRNARFFVLRHGFLGHRREARARWRGGKRVPGGAEGSVCPVGTWAEGPKRPEAGQRNHERDR